MSVDLSSGEYLSRCEGDSEAGSYLRLIDLCSTFPGVKGIPASNLDALKNRSAASACIPAPSLSTDRPTLSHRSHDTWIHNPACQTNAKCTGKKKLLLA